MTKYSVRRWEKYRCYSLYLLLLNLCGKVITNIGILTTSSPAGNDEVSHTANAVVSGLKTSVRFTEFSRQRDYNETTCKSGDIVLFRESSGVLQCLILCANQKECATVFYDGQNCSACGGFYDVTEAVQIGSTLHFQRTFKCDDMWFSWKRSCYSLSPRGSFLEGQAFCASKGGHEITIETKEENEILKQYLARLTVDEPIYLGITDNCVGNGEWRQTQTGDIMPFFDFAMNEPNDPEIECCVVMYNGFNGQWADIGCSNEFSTICEKNAISD